MEISTVEFRAVFKYLVVSGVGSSMKTILIVDDDIAVRTMMKIVLNTNGFETLEAENGSVAFTLAAEKQPHLIISDVMMDNINGFMLLEMLRKDVATRRIPVMLITGEAQKYGAWDSEKKVGYFQKPLSMNDLLTAVKKRLRVKSIDDLNLKTKKKKKPK
jgi:CheY-like chemotaxis protein